MPVRSFVTACCLAVLLAAGPARADITPYAELDPTLPEVSLVVLPDESGPPATEARLFGGTLLDEPLRVRFLFEVWGDPSPPHPVPGYPAEDMWIQGPSLSLCQAGTVADTPTDVDGWVSWTSTMGAGGHGSPDAPMIFMVGGLPAARLDDPTQPVHVPWRLNSPDLNGDRMTNLTDVTLFAGFYYGAYDYRADFVWDGMLNLSDVSWLARMGINGCN